MERVLLGFLVTNWNVFSPTGAAVSEMRERDDKALQVMRSASLAAQLTAHVSSTNTG
jgi:hypothetical protein